MVAWAHPTHAGRATGQADVMAQAEEIATVIGPRKVAGIDDGLRSRPHGAVLCLVELPVVVGRLPLQRPRDDTDVATTGAADVMAAKGSLDVRLYDLGFAMPGRPLTTAITSWSRAARPRRSSRCLVLSGMAMMMSAERIGERQEAMQPPSGG
jgi:hypothetical protein